MPARHRYGTPVANPALIAQMVWLNHAASAWRHVWVCPQRDSNPRYHLERVATWAASRWGRRSQDTGGRSYHPWPPGRLAQLVERLPYTQVAAGSSPAPPISQRASVAIGSTRLCARCDWCEICDSVLSPVVLAIPQEIELSDSRPPV